MEVQVGLKTVEGGVFKLAPEAGLLLCYDGRSFLMSPSELHPLCHMGHRIQSTATTHSLQIPLSHAPFLGVSQLPMAT